MDKKRLEKLLASPEHDFTSICGTYHPSLIERNDATPGTEEWAEIICREYGAARDRFEKNQSDVSRYKQILAHPRGKSEEAICRGCLEAAKRQMDADFVSITLFEQGIRQLDDLERYVVVGRCAKKLKWEAFTYPDSGKKMSSNKVSSLLHSGLQNLADVMLDMFSYALEPCG